MMSDKLIDCSSISNKPFFNLKTFIMILKLELCVSCFSPSLSLCHHFISPSYLDFPYYHLFGFILLPAGMISVGFAMDSFHLCLAGLVVIYL